MALKYIVDIKTNHSLYIFRRYRWSSRCRFFGLYKQRFRESDASSTKVSKLSYLSIPVSFSYDFFLNEISAEISGICLFPFPVILSYCGNCIHFIIAENTQLCKEMCTQEVFNLIYPRRYVGNCHQSLTKNKKSFQWLLWNNF